MITGEIKSKIDQIWDAFASGGISNPLEVFRRLPSREITQMNKMLPST